MTERAFLIKWILASGAGMALGFLMFINILFFLAFGFEFERYWIEPSEGDVENAEQILRRGLAIGLPLAGAIFTSFQAVLLRRSAVDLRLWVLAGPLGFIVPVLLIWPFTAIWGDIPGPVEPFTIVGGGLIGVAFFQWYPLRRKGMGSKRWLFLWISGLPLGMIAFMGAYILIDLVLSIGWAAEIGLIGFATGGCAAALSGRALLRAISVETSAAA
jgi:hypothetical protein